MGGTEGAGDCVGDGVGPMLGVGVDVGVGVGVWVGVGVGYVVVELIFYLLSMLTGPNHTKDRFEPQPQWRCHPNIMLLIDI